MPLYHQGRGDLEIPRFLETTQAILAQIGTFLQQCDTRSTNLDDLENAVDRMTDVFSTFDVLRQNVPGNSVTLNRIVRDAVTGNENFSDSRFPCGIREICENRSVPRHFLTILAGFILCNPLRVNFGACDKLTTGLARDLGTCQKLAGGGGEGEQGRVTVF